MELTKVIDKVELRRTQACRDRVMMVLQLEHAVVCDNISSVSVFSAEVKALDREISTLRWVLGLV